MDQVDEAIEVWRRELPQLIGPTSEFEKRLMVLGALLTEVTRRTLVRFDLTVAEYDVIVALRRAAAPYRMKSNALSHVLLLSSGGTTNVINRLTARELTERHPDPADRRSTWIQLTATGVDLAEDAVRACGAARAEVLSGVPTATLTSATRALRKVSAALPTSGLPLFNAG